MGRAAEAMPISPGQREALEVLSRSGTARSGGAAGAGAAAGGGRPAERADRRRGGGDAGLRPGVADAVRRGGAGQVRASARGPGAQAVDPGGDRGRDRAGDVARDAAGGDALVHPHHGGAGRSQPGHLAALDVLTGAVIGQCLPRHRHDEFLVFLRRIQREVPRGLQVHLILDNYATHSHPDVQAWLAKHPRFHLHFTPTSSSWLNLVERWFRNLTDKRLRRGSFNSVADLIAAIEEYLTIHNEDPKPFVWTATADSILAKVRRGRVARQQVVTQ